MPQAREALIRRGLHLNYLTIVYNVLEAVGSLWAGVISGSVALVGFGVDSLIEVSASGVAQWRLRSDLEGTRREYAERISFRLIGVSFLALAVYVAYDAIATLITRDAPAPSLFGLVVLALSAVAMPLLARAKREVAHELSSGALRSEARQTSLCAYLSVIAITGVVLNAIAGWWWADPAAALSMVPIIAREGIEGIRKSDTL